MVQSIGRWDCSSLYQWCKVFNCKISYQYQEVVVLAKKRWICTSFRRWSTLTKSAQSRWYTERSEVSDNHHQIYDHVWVWREITIAKKITGRNVIFPLLRACTHPYLLDAPLDENGEIVVNEELIASSGKFIVLDKMLAKLQGTSHKVEHLRGVF